MSQAVFAVIAGWSRPPQVALAIAELYLDASAQLAAAKTCSTSQQANTKSTTRTFKHKINSLMHGCTANLSLFEAALLQQPSHMHITAAPVTDDVMMDMDSTATSTVAANPLTEASPQACELQARYHWLRACISEQHKHTDEANQQLNACKAIIHALAAATNTSQQAVRVAPAPAAVPAITAQAVDKKLEALSMVIMVEEGKQFLQQGQYGQLIARLAPVLLSSDQPGSATLDTPHQLAGLQLLQVYTPCGWLAINLKSHCLLSLSHQAGTWSKTIADTLLLLLLCKQHALCISQGQDDARRCCTACATNHLKHLG